jgi:hypothetical protein
MEESRLVDQFIVNVVDSVIFTQYVQRAFATDNFSDESSSQHFSIRPDIPSYISKEIPELDDPSLSSKLQEWLEQQLTKRFGAENQLSNKLYSSDDKDLVGIGTSVSSEFNHSTKSQARSSQASTNNSTDGLHNNPLSKVGKLTANEKFDVIEKRLARDQNVLESTIGFGHVSNEISVSSSFATSPSNQPPALMQTKKKNSNISVVKYNKEEEMKQPPSDIFPKQLQHHSSVIVRNLAYLYAALVLGKAVNFDGKHVSEDALLSASRLKMQQIPISNLISLLQKLVKVSTNAANNMTSRVPQDIEWAEFLVILVEMLIPVVKALGKNVIEMLVRCKAFKTWRYRSILEDQIDANLVPLEHVNQDRLFSYLAEKYTKPFSDEDNRNEQKSKVRAILSILQIHVCN